MPKRLAETYGEGGLVIEPVRRRCLGRGCSLGPECFTDGHHLYFEADLYRDNPVAHEFREHPLNILKMARCVHLLVHAEYDVVPIPDEEIMHGYLEEADFTLRYTQRVEELAELERVLNYGKPQDREEWFAACRKYGEEFVLSLWDIEENGLRDQALVSRNLLLNEVNEMVLQRGKIRVLSLENRIRAARRIDRIQRTVHQVGGLVLPPYMQDIAA